MATVLKRAWIIVALVAVVPAAAGAQEVLRMEEVTIEGEVQKPQASYILTRSGKADLGVDLREFRPQMTRGYGNLLDERPELFRTNTRR